MEFLEVLTEGLERVLLVRGGGREVITIYSELAIRLRLRVEVSRVPAPPNTKPVALLCLDLS